MALSFRNLDAETRKEMLVEIEAAIPANDLYFSKRFTDEGTTAWPSLLQEAAREHDDHWLAYQLEASGHIKGLEGSRTPTGGYTTKHVPHTAAETMAEGQFNRYYMMGVCRRAISNGSGHVTVYRAKEVNNPRPESQAMIDQQLNAEALLKQIRAVDTSLGHELLKPNSGLSVHL